MLQQGLLSVSTVLSVSVLVTEVVCGRDDGEFKAQVLSATFFMVGLSTFSMSTFGIRCVSVCFLSADFLVTVCQVHSTQRRMIYLRSVI